MAVPIGSSAKGGLYLELSSFVATFRVAGVSGVALRDISTRFMTCQKWFCVAGECTFATFSRDALHCSWQAQLFADVQCHYMRGRGSTLDVSFVACFLRIALSAVREEMSNSVAGVTF